MRSITSFSAHLRSCRGQHHWKYLLLNSHSVLVHLLLQNFLLSFLAFLEKNHNFTTSLLLLFQPSPDFHTHNFFQHLLIHFHFIWVTGCTQEKKISATETFSLLFFNLKPWIHSPTFKFLTYEKKSLGKSHVMSWILYCPNYINSAFSLTFSAFPTTQSTTRTTWYYDYFSAVTTI